MTAGIAGLGAYAPRLRIDTEMIAEALGQADAAGIDRKAVPEADEDALTMAFEAATQALDAAEADGDDIRHLAFATTTPPMDEEDLTARLANMLGAPGAVRTHTETGSTRAGATALDAALDASHDGIALVVASDCPQSAPDSRIEHAAGAGAAAAVIDASGVAVVDSASHVEPYPGTRFRERGDSETTGLGITQYDRDAFTGTLEAAAAELSTDTDTIDATAVQSPDGKLPYRAAGALGVETETIAAASTVNTLGDTGAASTLIGAARSFANGAERVLLAAYGSGAGATLLVVDGTVPVETQLDGDTNLSYADYLRRRGELTSGEPEGGGAYVSVPSWQRTAAQRHQLIAGRCMSCSALQFPPEGACPHCNELSESEPVKLPGTGTVEAVTTICQGGAPPEFVEQQGRSGAFVSAVVSLDGPNGERVSIPSQVVTTDPEKIAVGTTVQATMRRIYEQEGVVRYGFKMEVAGESRS